MKKLLYVLSGTICLLAIITSLYASKQKEALATEEPQTGQIGAVVVCKCAGFLGNNQCKASNSKEVCAGGNNIQCQEYNGNC